jgi:hemerythrin superfamily protein
MKKARDYLLASTFLKDVKKNGITYKKLKGVLFGEHAIAFIAAVRKHGQVAFKELKESHQFMYMVETAMESLYKKQNQINSALPKE